MALPKITLPKKYLPLIVAIASGLLAVFLINIYITQQTEEAKKREAARQKNLVSVMVAKVDIPAGTTIKENMVKEEIINKSLTQPRVATSMDRVVDRIAIAPIAKGEQILLNKVTLSGMETSLSSKVPKGKRAITIPVDNISSVGGMIRPGDHVDIVGLVPIPGLGAEGKAQMTSLPLFQDVTILAVGQEYTSIPGAQKGEKALSPIITLALPPEQANLVAFVLEQGKIRLILRSPEDAQVQPATPATWDALFRMVMPERFVQAPVEPPKPKKQVEIYRGLQKEVKALE